MAVYKIFPEKSSTLYSFYPTLNTGNDEILEVSTFESINGTNEVSRAVIKFPTSEISLVMGLVSSSVFAASLNLFVANASSLPSIYTLEAHALSQDWNHGTGRLSNVPITTDGVSWKFRNELDINLWPTSSFPVGTTGSYDASGNAGGGNWWTASSFFSAQTFGPEIVTKDTNFNITQMVDAWHNNAIPNYGIILKHSSSVEFSSSSKFELKYFSEHTHTIYPPCLEIKWNDTSYSTGSLNVVTSSYYTVVINNNKEEYQQDSVQKFRIAVRDLYPSTSFRTSLSFANQKCLPITSYWAIKDLDTEEIVVDYDYGYTKIGCDPTGNYFTVYMNGLEPERYYKILLKTILPDGETIIMDKDYIFKVIR